MKTFRYVMVVALCSGGPVLATGSCGYERCFGAIAVGQSGATSRTAGHRTLPDAEKTVRAQCGDSCDVEVFWNACGAVAMAPNGDWTFGWDPALDLAQAGALASCEAESEQSCYVRDWICTK